MFYDRSAKLWIWILISRHKKEKILKSILHSQTNKMKKRRRLSVKNLWWEKSTRTNVFLQIHRRKANFRIRGGSWQNSIFNYRRKHNSQKLIAWVILQEYWCFCLGWISFQPQNLEWFFSYLAYLSINCFNCSIPYYLNDQNGCSQFHFQASSL